MLVRIQVSYTLTSDTCTYLRLLDNGLDRPKHVRYIIYIQGIHKIMVHFQKLTRKKRRTTMVRLFQTVHETHAALNHRSGHLKTEHTESLFLLRRHLGNWPRSKHEKRTAGSAWETWTVTAADGVRCARVRWEINFLLTFEAAPFFYVYPVYNVAGELNSSVHRLAVLILRLMTTVATENPLK